MKFKSVKNWFTKFEKGNDLKQQAQFSIVTVVTAVFLIIELLYCTFC